MTLTLLRRTTTALLVVVATTAIAAAGLHGSAVGTLGTERAAVVVHTDAHSAIDSLRGAGSAVAVAAAPVVTAPATTTTTTTTTVVPADGATEIAAPAAPTPQPTPAPAPAPTPTTAPPAPAPAPAPSPATTSHGTRVASCESNMVRWGNEVRAANGLAALVNDPGIESIPVNWSDGMAGRQQLAHNPRYGEQIFAARPQAVTAGENVGRGSSDRAIFQGFMDSPGHRARIVDRSNTHTTVGCVRDAAGVLWVTVNFWG